MRALVLVLVLSLLVGVSGCGSKDVSTGPSKSTVNFVNKVPSSVGWTFIVEVPSAHQYFELGPEQRKVVELVADDGSTEFEFTVTKKGTQDTTTGVVSLGQEVAMMTSGTAAEGYSVYVEGEELLE